MGDQQHAAREAGEHLLQPLQTGVVQVIPRLIQHQQPGIPQQRPRQREQVAFAAGQQSHGPSGRAGQPYPLQGAFGLPRRLIAVQSIIAIAGCLVAPQSSGHPFLGRPRQAVLRGPQRALGRRHLTQQILTHLHRRRGVQLLRHETDLEIRVGHHHAGARLLRTPEQVQQRGLAGTVSANQPHLVARIDLEGDVAQDILVCVVF